MRDMMKMVKADNREKDKPKPVMLGIDSKMAIENIERSSSANKVQQWLELLEPVKFVDQHN